MLASPLILPSHLLRYGTFCSGIEAVTVAWEGLGWHPAFFSEIARFPCAVLKARYPNVPNLGDMTLVDGGSLQGLLDIIVAGTPCQSFSVAGLRMGLTDERGNLTLELVKIYDASKTAYLLWENVPGVLSDRGNAFGCFLGALSGENEALLPPGGKWTDAGYVLGPKRAIAWRVLDAQYFGLAQRRRRVFLVAGPRDGADPREILFESDGLRRDFAPRRKKTQDIAGSLTARFGRNGGSANGDITGNRLVCCFGGNNHSGAIDISPALQCNNGMKLNFEHDAFIAHTLRGGGYAASEDGTGRQNLVVMPINTQVGLRHNALGERTGLGIGDDGAPAFTLQGAHSHAVAILPSGEEDAVPALTKNFYADDGTRDGLLVPQPSAVRRLTPLECERLMGFPDGYTALTDYPAWRDLDEHEAPEELSAAGYKVRRTKKGVWRVNDPDGPRYMALGNSMAVDVIEWLGSRIRASILREVRA